MAKDFRSEILADLIRESAQDIMDMAYDIAVAADDYLSDFDIWMRFPPDGVPTIEIFSSVKSKRCCKILKRYFDKQGESRV